MANIERKIIGNKPCPKCRSNGRDKTGNHLILFSDGSGYCNRCSLRLNAEEADKVSEDDVAPTKKSKLSLDDIIAYQTLSIVARGLKSGALKHFGVKTGVSEASGEVCKAYFPYYQSGKLVAYKQKGYPKEFLPAIGSLKNAEFFGQHLADTNSKRLIITEGEEDCIAAFSMMRKFRDKGDEKYANHKVEVVSLPAGANSVKTTFSAQLDFLLKFDEILLCFDNDEPGKQAVKDAVEVLGYNQSIKVMELPKPYKDANDALVAGDQGYRDFINAYFKAKNYVPTGIVRGSDISLDELKVPREPGLMIEEMPALMNMLGGLRGAEMTIIAASPSAGKSTYARIITYYLTAKYNQKVGFISLETPLNVLMKQGIALHNQVPNKLLMQDSNILSDEEWESGYEVVKKEIYVSHFGNITAKDVIDKMHYLVYHEKCKFILLDHLTCVFNSMKGNKVEAIDEFLGELSSFVVKTDAHLLCISHINRGGNDTPASMGGKINTERMRGSSMLEGYAWNLLLLERDISAGSNTISVRCTKNRTWGETGFVCYANYLPNTGWLVEETNEQREERQRREANEQESESRNMVIKEKSSKKRLAKVY